MSSEPNWTLSALAETIADTDRYAGGGVVAAMSLAGATATVELVIQLSRRRKRITEDQATRLGELAEATRRMRADFLRAIDEDIDSLNQLMEAQSDLRRARKGDEYGDIPSLQSRADTAARAALETPLAVARQGDRLLQVIEEVRPTARRFTVSDLGAAAASARGAIESLLLMAEVNVGLVEDRTYQDHTLHEIEELFERAREQSDVIIAATRSAMRADRSHNR